jgi:hypothetical protein
MSVIVSRIATRLKRQIN